MLSGIRMKEINLKYGLSHSLVAKWKREDKEFQEAFREASQAITKESIDALKGFFSKAVDTLHELLDSSDQRIQLEVCKLILNSTFAKDWLKENPEPPEKVGTGLTMEKFEEIFGRV